MDSNLLTLDQQQPNGDIKQGVFNPAFAGLDSDVDSDASLPGPDDVVGVEEDILPASKEWDFVYKKRASDYSDEDDDDNIKSQRVTRDSDVGSVGNDSRLNDFDGESVEK